VRAYHTALIDPSLGEVAEEIALAGRAANRGCRTRLLADDPAKARKVARQAGGSPEGIAHLRGGRGGIPASQVLVGWWTDHIGRKHVVVRGRRVDLYDSRYLLRPETLAERPPLWHCYPDRLYRRQAAGPAHWVAACGCGATGPPEALGWMGDVCGPCHDRRLEFGPAALADQTPGLLAADRRPVTALAFRADGRVLVGADGFGTSNGLVHVWTLPDGAVQHRLRTPDREPPYSVAATADGRFVVTAGRPPFAEDADAVRPAVGYDLSADPPAAAPLTADLTFGVVAGPGPGEVTVATDGGFAALDPGTRRLTRGIAFENTWASPPFVSADGRHLVAVRPGTFAVYEWHTGRRVGVVPFSPELGVAEALLTEYKAAYLADGRWLFAAAGGVVQAFDAATGRVRATRRLPGTVRHLSVDPAGRHVLVGLAGGTVLALDLNLSIRVMLAWHLLGVRAFAVSADGGTLATAGPDGGVKLWPIARLVGDG
jgi:hypothetical protein